DRTTFSSSGTPGTSKSRMISFTCLPFPHVTCTPEDPDTRAGRRGRSSGRFARDNLIRCPGASLRQEGDVPEAGFPHVPLQFRLAQRSAAVAEDRGIPAIALLAGVVAQEDVGADDARLALV